MNYLLFLFFAFYNFSMNSEKFDLKITVTNVNKLRGNIEVGIFNDEKFFLEKGKEYKTYTKSVTEDTIVFVITGLTKADYAISIYHDINADKVCNLNFFGIPKEPYGFSQNFKPKLSKPSFKDCKIELNNNKSIMINLID